MLDAIGQCRAFNDSAIYFVTEARNAALIAFPPDLRVHVINTEDLNETDKLAEFRGAQWLNRTFREGFWTHTTERFFVIESLMETLGLADVIHLENDNLLYFDACHLLPAMRTLRGGLGATFDADDRCVPGIVYMRDRLSTSRLTSFLIDRLRSSRQGMNDMTLIAAFRQAHGSAGQIDALPVVPAGYPRPMSNLLGQVSLEPEIYSRNFASFGGVFDAAAIGQFLAGVDQRNSNGQDTRGFINETSMYNPSKFEYLLGPGEKGIPVPHLRMGETVCPIFNLHIHSKNLRPYCWR